MTGPTPNRPVRLVPLALTAVSSFFLVSRICPSMRRRSSIRAAASSQRAAATASGGVIEPSSRAACAAMIFFGTPPGTSSQSTACSRHTTWVRLLARSRRRLDQTFSTAAWSSGRASRTPGERSAATATDRASLGSFLFTFPVASSRTRAPSLGCTSSTRSPGGQQLLGQQVAQAAGALDRPGPLRPGRGPCQQPLRLRGAGAHPQLPQRLLGPADRHRRVRGLVRVDPDHHSCHRPAPPPGALMRIRGGHA